MIALTGSGALAGRDGEAVGADLAPCRRGPAAWAGCRRRGRPRRPAVRSASMSPASMTPSTGRFCAVSNFLTAFSVPAPNSPSTPTLKPALREEVLQDPDVVAAHPALDAGCGRRGCGASRRRRRSSGRSRRWRWRCDPRSARLQGRDGARADRAAGLRREARWKRLTARSVPGAELAVDLDLEAGLARAPAAARARRRPEAPARSGAVAEVRRLGRPAGERAGRGDDGHAQGEHGNDRRARNDDRTAARQLETPLFGRLRG